MVGPAPINHSQSSRVAEITSCCDGLLWEREEFGNGYGGGEAVIEVEGVVEVACWG